MFISRDRSELERDFRDTFSRLVRGGAAFDEGHASEAAGIAAAVYVFVHEGGKRRPSLLTLLGLKSKLKFVDSARSINPKNLMTEHPLVMLENSGEKFRYFARRDLNIAPNPPTSFSKWWEKSVLRDRQRREFSRKNLIHFFRHYRGGGHAGRQHEPQGDMPAQAFADLARVDPGNWMFQMDGQTFVAEYGADYASVRQIGWELEQSLRAGCPDLIPHGSPTSMRMQSVDPK